MKRLGLQTTPFRESELRGFRGERLLESGSRERVVGLGGEDWITRVLH